MTKTALITGVAGQDGAYLSRFLLEKGYRVVGALRRSANAETSRLSELGVVDDVELVSLEMLELSDVKRTVESIAPDEIYNLAAQSLVASSFKEPIHTADVNAMGPLRLLEAIRATNSKARFYQASTSEMFGMVQAVPQNETTPFYPRSPYGIAKVFAHWATVNYREAYGLHASSGLLFNHESPLRGREFVTRKITAGLAMIKRGQRQKLTLGNLNAQRDWGFAGDYVEAMWQMLQQPAGDDYVIASGETRSVRQFVQSAARCFDMKFAWQGEGADERAIDTVTGEVIVDVDPKFFRPAEVNMVLGDASKAQKTLGWKRRTGFGELVAMMVEADLRRATEGAFRV